MATLRRHTHLDPGHDCIRHPCGKNGCGTFPGSSHGIGGESWLYAVSDGQVAISIRIYTTRYPASVPRSGCANEPPKGAGFSTHTTFPTRLEQLKSEAGKEPCEFVEAGCFNETGYLYSDEVWKRAGGVDAFEQPESFWLELEREWQRAATEAYASRVDTTHERCPTCGGSGVAAK